MVVALLVEALVWGLVAGPEIVPVVLVLVLETVILVTEISLQACCYHLRFAQKVETERQRREI
jgi:hypothetical protein